MSKKNELELAKKEAESTITQTNKKIEELGNNVESLYKELSTIQDRFDKIRNVPSDKKTEYEKTKKVVSNWKQHVEKIEKAQSEKMAKEAGVGVAGVGAGIAVAACGPSVAMGIATTFGVASTGTAISTLSGAAATNAALAWLGGGAIAAGGGGMAAGKLLLTLAGPVGWAIAGVSLLGSGIFLGVSLRNQNKLYDIFISISKRDTKKYKLSIQEINSRIELIKDAILHLRTALIRITSFGLDYMAMTESQQYELGSYVNLMYSSTQLLVEPIKNLQPFFDASDYDSFLKYRLENNLSLPNSKYQDAIISLCNLIFNIYMEDRDRTLFCNAMKKNKDFLSSLRIDKDTFENIVMVYAFKARSFKYKINREAKIN